VELAQRFDRPFPWRVAALAAAAVALAELSVLLAMAGANVFGAHHHAAAQTSRNLTPPTSDTGRVSTKHVALRPRSRISVLVLNGNGISGVAGSEASRLLSAGYRRATSGDAPSEAYARSLVLFRPGWQGEAQRLAHDARILTVAPLDGTLARSYAGYRLVLILGAN
jgi:LytR cell envelope-related transcriptional attenuator